MLRLHTRQLSRSGNPSARLRRRGAGTGDGAGPAPVQPAAHFLLGARPLQPWWPEPCGPKRSQCPNSPSVFSSPPSPSPPSSSSSLRSRQPSRNGKPSARLQSAPRPPPASSPRSGASSPSSGPRTAPVSNRMEAPPPARASPTRPPQATTVPVSSPTADQARGPGCHPRGGARLFAALAPSQEPGVILIRIGLGRRADRALSSRPSAPPPRRSASSARPTQLFLGREKSILPRHSGDLLLPAKVLPSPGGGRSGDGRGVGGEVFTKVKRLSVLTWTGKERSLIPS